MGRTVEFTLDVPPQAWERVARSKGGHAYVPPKTREFKKTVGLICRLKRLPLFQGPLILTARFIVQAPKSVKRERPWVRPDLDNYMKSLKDALNGVAWVDDAQVVEYGVGTGKYYARDGSLPRIEVSIQELTP